MRWRIVVRLIGATSVAAALVVALSQVHVGGPGATGRSCGSALDVIVDRADWETWYAQDAADPPARPASPLLRTLRCPNAVNARTRSAGVLLGVGLVAGVAAHTVRRRDRSVSTTAELARLGRVVGLFGAALTIGGLVALALVVADRDAPMFDYVGRPSVLALGLVALAPVLALAVGGRALVLLSHHLADEERDHAPT